MKRPSRSTVNISAAKEVSDICVEKQHRWRRSRQVETEPKKLIVQSQVDGQATGESREIYIRKGS